MTLCLIKVTCAPVELLMVFDGLFYAIVAFGFFPILSKTRGKTTYWLITGVSIVMPYKRSDFSQQ